MTDKTLGVDRIPLTVTHLAVTHIISLRQGFFSVQFYTKVQF